MSNKIQAEPSSLICALEGHDFEHGPRCLDCDAVNPDYDPTPQGAEMVTDNDSSSSYPWNQKGQVA